MNKTAATFLLVAVLAALLAALSIAIQIKGYPFGALGLARIDALANASSFIPLAAIYAFSAVLMLLLPLRAAGFVFVNAAAPVHSATLVLLATIIGLQGARAAFGNLDALWKLVDWQFVFAAAIVGVHLMLNALRRNVLVRTIGFVVFTAATLACLYWTFRL